MRRDFIRKDPHHEIIELSGKPTLVFITLGIEDIGTPWVATPEVHSLLRAIWLEATAWKVNRYELMPDHLHFFSFPGNSDIPFRRWMAYWKRLFNSAYHRPRHEFQTDYWDVTIRSAAHYQERIDYMRMNPVVKGLVIHPDQWPYQGIIHDFTWMEH